MRNPAGRSLAFPARGFARLFRSLRWSKVAQPAAVAGAIALVVCMLLVGLPAKPVTAAQAQSTFVPLAPQADAGHDQGTLPLDVPFQIQFTKPMNAGTVAAALTIPPTIKLQYLWDATGQVLSIKPIPYWAPYTQYTVDISHDATDQEGLNLANTIHSSFQSGSPTSAIITATRMVGTLAAPTTAVKIAFTRPVKLATVERRLSLYPPSQVSVTGDDPTDAASQVFTITPKKPLQAATSYQVSIVDGGTDSAGAPLQHIPTLYFTTLAHPSAKITPQDGTVTYDSNQVVSVAFSEAMDQKSAAGALSVTSNGRAVAGSISWTDDGLTMVFNTRYSYYQGSRITVSVAASARSAAGMQMASSVSSSFSVAVPKTRASSGTYIPYSPGGLASTTAPWHGSELYYLSLMNCTRTGGWVTGSGLCSTQTHHTLPARGPLGIIDGISNRVSRPYAAALAAARQLTHYLGGTTAHSRLTAGGYPSPSWGENIASPGDYGQSGMISIETFFQNEYACRCEHYANIMNSHFNHVGIGVWYDGVVRVVIDFYA